MSLVSNVLAVLLALICGASALMDFRRPPHLVEELARLRIPAAKIPQLGVVKIVLVLGLLLGFSEVRVGEVAGAGLVAYFAVATVTHTRVRDGLKATAPAFALLVLSALYSLVTFAK